MSEEDNSLIGYDPLAWMEENDGEPSLATPEPTIQIEAESEKDREDESVSADSDANAEPTEIAEDSAIVLEPELKIQHVAQLHEELMTRLDRSEKLEIDASAVTSIDTATLQLLIVLKQTAIKSNKGVVIDFPSDKFIEASELLGLSEMLDVNQAAAGFF